MNQVDFKKSQQEYQKFCEKIAEIIGCCPRCGRVMDWFNDIPVAAYCWGDDEKRHREVKIRLPKAAEELFYSP